MRVTIVGALLGALPLLSIAAEGDYCAIPKLEQGKPTVVEVPYIDKPFCGTALIDRHYVHLTEFTKVHEETPVSCSSDALCTKTFRYYLDEKRETEPYIIIFQGPKQPKPT
jgi:hypothetical protein